MVMTILCWKLLRPKSEDVAFPPAGLINLAATVDPESVFLEVGGIFHNMAANMRPTK